MYMKRVFLLSSKIIIHTTVHTTISFLFSGFSLSEISVIILLLKDISLHKYVTTDTRTLGIPKLRRKTPLKKTKKQNIITF